MCKYEEVVRKVQALLEDNKGWEDTYAEYAEKILQQSSKIEEAEGKISLQKPLFIYMPLTNAMKAGNPKFSLRYLGQDVASLTVEKEKAYLKVSKDFHKNNIKYFGYQGPIIEKAIWDDNNAKSYKNHFIDHFNNHGKRNDNKNEEHRLESALLTELEKAEYEDNLKSLNDIKPVKICNLSRFQMKTPIRASQISNIYYKGNGGARGGGIDVLCQVSEEGKSKLCIMELKTLKTADSKKALKQGLAYATFIRALLRSKSGQDWYKIFGFDRVLPGKDLKIQVACAMPSTAKNDYSFSNKVIAFNDGTGDEFELHYMYFKEEKNIIEEVETSLNNS